MRRLALLILVNKVNSIDEEGHAHYSSQDDDEEEKDHGDD